MKKPLRHKDMARSARKNLKIRDIPFGMKFKIIFGQVTSIIGLGFFFMGMLFMLIFGSMVNFKGSKISDDDPVKKGTITQVASTNSSQNDVLIYAYHYTFKSLDGSTHTGVSYQPGKIYNEGDEVEIQFSRNEPQNSTIVGMRSSAMPFWVLLIILPFVLIGAGFLAWNITKGIGSIRILERGVLGKGILKYKTPTNTEINNRRVYELVFEFTAQSGKVYEAIGRSHIPERLEDEVEEPLVYIMSDPYKAVLLDTLPRSVRRYFEKIYPETIWPSY